MIRKGEYNRLRKTRRSIERAIRAEESDIQAGLPLDQERLDKLNLRLADIRLRMLRFTNIQPLR